jgi:hypothetical protein
MDYRISGLDPAPFVPLFGRSDDELRAAGARRYVADARPGFPCRVTLTDAEPGTTLLLVNFVHLDADTPYRAAHAIFVREDPHAVRAETHAVPEMLRTRLLSVRAYDADDMMVDADVVAGASLEPAIERWFSRPDVAYLHAHTANRGCYLARIDCRSR